MRDIEERTKRKPRGKYGLWSQQDLNLAIRDVKEKRLGLNAASRTYGVRKATIKRHLEGKNKRSASKAMGRQPVFSSIMEDELTKHILLFEERIFGLTTKDVRKLAFDVAKKYGIANQFNQEKGMAGKAWYYSFMARRIELSLRQPEATSMQRLKGFTKERVDKFFKILEDLVAAKNLNGSKIYNVDKSGFTTVQKKPSKVVGKKGKRQVGAATSGERGVNTTIVCCTNGAGNYVPPMIIFKRKRKPQELEIGSPMGSLVEISDTGYINSELFVTWLQHFHSHVYSTAEEPVLLLLDGHATHSKNLAAIEYSRDHGIIMLQLPSHTTHKLQPLDVAFFCPLGRYYIEAQEKWLRNNVGKTISQFQVAELLGEAYGRAASVRTSANAFKASGIWPLDRLIFEESLFSASRALEPAPLESTDQSPSHNGSVTFRDILNEVSPVPHASTSGCPKKAPRLQDAVVLTSSPYKNELQARKRVKPPEPKGAKAKRLLSFGNESIRKSGGHEDSDSSSSDKLSSIGSLADSSGGEEFVSEDELPTEPAVNIDNLKKGDFVLIGLSSEKAKKVYYVAQIEAPKTGTSDCVVIYLKKSVKHRNGFVFPTVVKSYPVADNEIEMVLNPVSRVGTTKRQNSVLTFGVNFDNIGPRCTLN